MNISFYTKEKAVKSLNPIVILNGKLDSATL